MPARAGIKWPIRAMRRVRGSRDVGPRAKTRIDQTARTQPVEHSAVVGEVIGLPPHRAIPYEAEPGEIGQDCRLERALAAPDVDILDAQQERAARIPCPMPAFPRRIGRAEMQ